MNVWGVRSARSAVEIVDDIAAGRSSAMEEAVAALKRVKALQASTNAFLTIDEQATLDMARHVDSGIASGQLKGPMAGLPMSIKDTEDTKGIRTTYGSAMFADHIPAKDGLLADRFRQAGVIFTGKTNTPSFAHKDMTDNLLGPPCAHPLDSTLTPGGSSGGAAVSVALGVEPIAHASDGAGSIRIPAALCGIIGFKPSSGVIPVPELEDLWETKLHNGFVSQSVVDIAYGMSVIAGSDPRAPTSFDLADDWLDCRDDNYFRNRRVLYAPLLFRGNLDADVRERLDHAVADLEKRGALVEKIEEPPFEDPGLWFDAAIIFRRRKMYAHMAANAELYEPSLRRNIIKSKAMTLDDVLSSSDQRTVLYRKLTELIAPHDLLITSSIPTRPWKIDGVPVGYPGGGLAEPSFRWPELYAFNMTGWPAASVPCGFTSDGFPVGIQFVGKWRRDVDVLRATWSYLEGKTSYDHLMRFSKSEQKAS